MSEVEVVRIPAQPGGAEELGTVVAAARDGGYLAAPRCAELRVLASEQAAEVLVIMDWRSRADHDEAVGEPSAGELFGRIAELAAGEPAMAWYGERG
jgi:hypothetical protein